MLFTDSSCHTERLTEATISRLLASDRVDRYQDCGWHCATGYKDGRPGVGPSRLPKRHIGLRDGVTIASSHH
jgi:hypothetical protein